MMDKYIVLAGAVLCVFIAASGHCQGTLVSESLFSADLNLVFAYGIELMEQGDYYRAISAFKWVRFVVKEGRLAQEALLNIARCYRESKHYDQAVETYLRFNYYYPSSPHVERASFDAAILQKEAGELEFAAASLDGFISDYPQSSLVPRARFHKAMCRFNLGYIEQACRMMESIARDYPGDTVGITAANLSEQIRRGLELPKKSPTLAGILCIVPGLGQFYCGYYGEGVMAIVFNGIFGYLTYDAIRKGKQVDDYGYATAGAWGFIELIFYSGNIYNGIMSAKKFNHRAEERFLREINAQGYLP